MVNTTLSPMVLEHAQKYYDHGHSLRETQKQFGISRVTLIKHLKTRRPKHLTEEEIRQRDVNKVVRWRRRIKEWLTGLFGSKCVCGYSGLVDNLTFHHTDPTQKDFQISGSTQSKEKIKQEAGKCVMLCRNCHGAVHSDNTQITLQGNKKRMFELYSKVNELNNKTAIAIATFDFTEKWGYMPHEETFASDRVTISSLQDEGWDDRVKQILSEFSDLKQIDF